MSRTTGQQELVDKYLPHSGEGETMATQAVTAVCKLTYKWYNDGDVYDNRYAVKGWVNNISTFANWLYNNSLGSDILLRIQTISASEYEDLLMDLENEILRKELLEELDKKPMVGSVYSDNGPFEFVY